MKKFSFYRSRTAEFVSLKVAVSCSSGSIACKKLMIVKYSTAVNLKGSLLVQGHLI